MPLPTIPDKLPRLRPCDSDLPNVSKSRPTLPPLLRRPDDGLDIVIPLPLGGHA